ncbi:hypothetical protein BKA70DRAFT_576350 [Coprinopsis sp. MPI-PUGE-AT-0042]|nr:hypothetical protein BKA70DRAFT_576350 [Coprinopsis sp. MPI-PUGE-AT-0042]
MERPSTNNDMTRLPASRAEPPRDGSSRKEPYPAAVHFAFVSGLLLPLTVLPWYLSRRHTAGLRLKLKEAEKKFRAVKLDLRTAMLQLDMTKTQHSQVLKEMKSLKREFEAVRAASAKLEARVSASEQSLKADVVGLRNEMNDLAERSAKGDSLRDVGQSLGRIAGFIHEMELHLGLETRGEDQRGIDQLRKIAVKLQSANDIQGPRVQNKEL